MRFYPVKSREPSDDVAVEAGSTDGFYELNVIDGLERSIPIGTVRSGGLF